MQGTFNRTSYGEVAVLLELLLASNINGNKNEEDVELYKIFEHWGGTKTIRTTKNEG